MELLRDARGGQLGAQQRHKLLEVHLPVTCGTRSRPSPRHRHRGERVPCPPQMWTLRSVPTAPFWGDAAGLGGFGGTPLHGLALWGLRRHPADPGASPNGDPTPLGDPSASRGPRNPSGDHDTGWDLPHCSGPPQQLGTPRSSWKPSSGPQNPTEMGPGCPRGEEAAGPRGCHGGTNDE